MSDIEIALRPLTVGDLPNLPQIRPTYKTETIFVLEKDGVGCEIGWRLIERAHSFDKGTLYDFGPEQQAQIGERLARPDDTYQCAAFSGGRLVGLLDVEIQHWNNTALLWNLMIDLDYRRQGLGRRFWHRALNFARQAGVRAIMIETQNTNVAACKFYAEMSCRLIGLNEVFYTNDGQASEVALFWAYLL
jgi:ribosomal protein S18 acetylase RimI-like enzyme